METKAKQLTIFNEIKDVQSNYIDVQMYIDKLKSNWNKNDNYIKKQLERLLKLNSKDRTTAMRIHLDYLEQELETFKYERLYKEGEFSQNYYESVMCVGL